MAQLARVPFNETVYLLIEVMDRIETPSSCGVCSHSWDGMTLEERNLHFQGHLARPVNECKFCNFKAESNTKIRMHLRKIHEVPLGRLMQITKK